MQNYGVILVWQRDLDRTYGLVEEPESAADSILRVLRSARFGRFAARPWLR
jgi:hypothetical protein